MIKTVRSWTNRHSILDTIRIITKLIVEMLVCFLTLTTMVTMIFIFQRVSVGAKVWVQLFEDDDGDDLTYLREISSNAAFLGQSEVYAHFGFGKISSMATMKGKSEDKILIYNVTVMWPIVHGKQYIESYLGNIPLRSEISVRRPSIHHGHERVIHHVYNGRAALNISCGKNPAEGSNACSSK